MKCYGIWDLFKVNAEGVRWLGAWVWQVGHLMVVEAG